MKGAAILPGMSMDPRDTVNKPGTNTNQGMHTRTYLMIVVVSVLVVLAVLLTAVFSSHSKGKPGPQTPATSSGQSNPTPQ